MSRRAAAAEFKQINLSRDIPKFIDEVEQEAVRILEANNLPTDSRQLSNEMIYEVTTGKKLKETLKQELLLKE